MEKNNSIHILLVEDDPNLGKFLKTYLESKGFPTHLETNGEAGLQAFLSNQYNFCITDVMMPVKDGFTMAKEIRKKNNKIPILFLTAKNLEEDRLKGFQIGADDYITKPFSMEELLLRVQAVARRMQPNEDEKEIIANNFFYIGQMKVDCTRQMLVKPDEEIKLTSRETDLLQLLCVNQNELVTRSQALNKIWHDDSYFNARTMDVYIAKLRKYLKGDPEVELTNVHGVGFKLIVGEKKNNKNKLNKNATK